MGYNAATLDHGKILVTCFQHNFLTRFDVSARSNESKSTLGRDLRWHNCRIFSDVYFPDIALTFGVEHPLATVGDLETLRHLTKEAKARNCWRPA